MELLRDSPRDVRFREPVVDLDGACLLLPKL